ncbi:MAG TPA: metallophosphoesterase, partial [Geodermatophilus sp.]|nr:metallophosphoesterase [Geodermatophilus sp.]
MSEPTPTDRGDRARRRRTAVRWLARVALTVAGALLGVVLLGRVEAPLGPFDATFALTPSGGGATVEIPPLGALDVDAFDGPLGLDVQLTRVDEARVRALVADPRRIDGLVDQVNADLQDAVVRLVGVSAAAAVGGAALTALVVLRR